MEHDSHLDSVPLSSILIHGIPAVDTVLEAITTWIRGWRDGSADLKCLAREAKVDEDDLQGAIKLRHKILDEPIFLKQIVGRLAGFIALHWNISTV
jgi:hypothetical protein